MNNGVGLNTDVLEKGKESHFGLRGVRERPERIGSKFTLNQNQLTDSGTVITLFVPGRIAFGGPHPSGLGHLKISFPHTEFIHSSRPNRFLTMEKYSPNSVVIAVS